MPNVRTLYQSFSGGEMSPEMFARLEDSKARSGAATVRNFIVTPQGPLINRPGFLYVREVKDSSKKVRLIPFAFSPTQTLVIEFGHLYCRFHTAGATVMNGAVPYEVATPYAEDVLFELHYAQSNDVLTLVHPRYAPRELRRLGATNWTLTPITFGAQLQTPPQPTVFVSRGPVAKIASTSQGSNYVTTAQEHGLSAGDSVYVSGVATNAGANAGLPDDFYVVKQVVGSTTITLLKYDGTAVSITGNGASGTIEFAAKSLGITSTYCVTAVDDAGNESAPSPEVTATNNLLAAGAYNLVQVSGTDASMPGTTRFSFYKKVNGLFGFVGQSPRRRLGVASGPIAEFRDDNIAPDLAVTPPISEEAFAPADANDWTNEYNSLSVNLLGYPGAVGYFEQRRVFAGTLNKPQNVWMTRTGTESDIRYSIPVKDTDRLAFQVAARERHTFRHVVPTSSLLMLTDAGEWRVLGVGDTALTPTTVAVRPQSYVGASNVQPAAVNNSVIFCAARGGHVRELGYNWNVQAFLTGDISLRATHLFDDYEIVDLAYSKAPYPVLWFVSTSGRLLGCTYIPEQQVSAWHWHDTQGAFESVAAVTEGEDDAVYVVAKRTINGSTRRFVERMAPRETVNLEDAVFVDSAIVYDGTNTSQFHTMTITSTSTPADWTPGGSFRLTAVGPVVFTAGQFIDNQPVYILTSADGTKVQFTATSYIDSNTVTGRVDREVPADLRAAATTSWAFARTRVGGGHLFNQAVSVLADGVVEPVTRDFVGNIILSRPAVKVVVGLPYVSDLQTMPLALQVDNGYGQGRQKNINKAWVRVYRSSGLLVGPTPDTLVEHKQRTTEPPGTPPRLATGELQVVLTPTWSNDGQVYVRQAEPLPLTVVGMALEVAVGG